MKERIWRGNQLVCSVMTWLRYKAWCLLPGRQHSWGAGADCQSTNDVLHKLMQQLRNPKLVQSLFQSPAATWSTTVCSHTLVMTISPVSHSNLIHSALHMSLIAMANIIWRIELNTLYTGLAQFLHEQTSCACFIKSVLYM